MFSRCLYRVDDISRTVDQTDNTFIYDLPADWFLLRLSTAKSYVEAPLRRITQPTPSLWLQMSWLQTCASPSATNMLTLLRLLDIIAHTNHDKPSYAKYIYIALQPLNRHCVRERPGGPQPVGFAGLLMQITFYESQNKVHILRQEKSYFFYLYLFPWHYGIYT